LISSRRSSDTDGSANSTAWKADRTVVGILGFAEQIALRAFRMVEVVDRAKDKEEGSAAAAAVF